MLAEFEPNEKEKKELRAMTPITEIMEKSTLNLLQDKSTTKIIESFDPNKTIIENPKKICARDGHSACIYNNNLIIFGGDRHQMAFNDLYTISMDIWEKIKN